ncbi:NUDIX hydrolase [Starkeya sp. ORNL1]|uniref:NUDIX hydrolase n=1 Tax=Starkeya sp. ORNL1 TaxID=2709380 RepID=UPI001FF03D68|nr:NUDIX hydrolase [Starkeya sp. ORNL1]
MPAEDEATVRPLRALEMVREAEPWAFAEVNRPAIDAHFAALKAEKPGLWNGRVLLLARHEVTDGVMRGAYRETDFASFMWWRDTGFPDPIMRNAFAMGALRGTDGGFVLGRMAGWTANAGRVYFAAGTPDPEDVTATGAVDLDGSVMRELAEETGLGAGDVTAAPGWQAVFIGPRIALMRPLVAQLDAVELAERIRAHLAREERPELDDVVIARGPQDISEAMPPFIRAYLTAVWGGLTD